MTVKGGYDMSVVEVVKGSKDGCFKVLVNHIQNGCELHSPQLANNHAKSLVERHYQSAKLVLIKT